MERIQILMATVCILGGAILIDSPIGPLCVNSALPDDVVAALLGQVETVESFSARYTFGIHYPSKEEVYIEDHVYRTVGPMKFFSRTKTRGSGEIHTRTFAFDGDIIYSLISGADGRPDSGRIGVPEWNKPLLYTSPVDLLGWSDNTNLAAQLDGATLSFREEAGVLVAIDESSNRRMDIHLDSEFRIRRIVRGYGIDTEIQGRYMEKYGEEPPDVFSVMSSVEIEEYTSVDGREFPIRGRRVFYQQDKELIGVLREQVKDGTLDPVEYGLRTNYEIPYEVWKEITVIP